MKKIEYDIEGPGLVKAIKQSVKSRKQIVIIYDYDNFGNILRIGYYLENNAPNEDKPQKIIWFNENEIKLKVKHAKSPQSPIVGKLNVSFKHPKANERHILIELPTREGNQIKLRNIFRISHNKLTSFVIQIEIKGIIKGKFIHKPIVRYDCAHGFLHRDLINIKGKKTKETLQSQDIRVAIETSINEIPNMLSQWLKKLGYEEISPLFLNQPLVIEDFDKAKLTLLNLVDDPASMDTTESKFIQIV